RVEAESDTIEPKLASSRPSAQRRYWVTLNPSRSTPSFKGWQKGTRGQRGTQWFGAHDRTPTDRGWLSNQAVVACHPRLNLTIDRHVYHECDGHRDEQQYERCRCENAAKRLSATKQQDANDDILRRIATGSRNETVDRGLEARVCESGTQHVAQM